MKTRYLDRSQHCPRRVRALQFQHRPTCSFLWRVVLAVDSLQQFHVVCGQRCRRTCPSPCSTLDTGILFLWYPRCSTWTLLLLFLKNELPVEYFCQMEIFPGIPHNSQYHNLLSPCTLAWLSRTYRTSTLRKNGDMSRCNFRLGDCLSYRST